MSSQPSNQKTGHDNKAERTSGIVEIQTEPIMVPFPLPPIGRAKSLCETISVAIQSDYTWMFNEFPVKQVLPTDSDANVVGPSPLRSPEPVLPLNGSPKKAAKRSVSKPVPVTTEVVEEQPEPETRSETVPVAPPSTPVISPSKREIKLSKKAKSIPATPTSEEAEPRVEPIKKKPSLIEPVIGDFSDDDHADVEGSILAPPPVKLTRVITPVQVKPSSMETPTESRKTSKKTTPVKAPPTTPASSSEDEAESPKKPAADESSSSDSDPDMPRVNTLLATPTQASSSKKKKAESPTTPVTPASPATPRFGPFVQIDNVSPDQAEYIKTKMLEKIPENMRTGSIKSGIHDPDNNRLIIQLRTHPKVVHFMSVDNGKIEVSSQGETRNMSILSETQKRKVVALFQEDVSSPPAKRSK